MDVSARQRVWSRQPAREERNAGGTTGNVVLNPKSYRLALGTNGVVNQIKTSGTAGFALQITKPARAAGLVDEDDNGDATFLADVRVFAFDHLLLVVDLEAVATEHITELVIAAARDTDSVYRALDATVQIAGHGYQVQLPPADDAGFEEGDRAPCHPAPGLVVISRDDGTSAGADAARLARDLISIRKEQI